MTDWPGGISAITLFVEDLEASKAFYQRAFGLPVFYEDPNSAVFQFNDTVINLLDINEAPSLIDPAQVATRDAGHRFQFTLAVDDVDAMVSELRGARRRDPQRPDRPPVGHPDRELRGSGRPHLGDREVGRGRNAGGPARGATSPTTLAPSAGPEPTTRR